MFGKKETLANHDLELFLIYDSKVNSYRDPISSTNRFDMIRAYENIVRKNPDDSLVVNSEDFSIFKIGEYHKKTGTIMLHEKEHIAHLHEIKNALLSRELRQQGIERT